VSAFANSAGGQIIYGIQEDGHHPVRVQDVDAVNPADISREWIEQVIESNIQPRIQNLRIQPIDLPTTAWPMSLRFRRQHLTLLTRLLTTNTTTDKTSSQSRWRITRSATPCGGRPRPRMRRATTPELYVRLSLPRGKTVQIEFAYQSMPSKPIILSALVGNRSAQPALYTFVRLGIDTGIISSLPGGDFTPVGERTDADGVPQNWLMRRSSTPPELPIFKEADMTRSSMPLAFPRLTGEHRFRITTLVQTPGYSASEHWAILQQGQLLQLLEPGHPRAR